jgi:hypothetical protein
MRKTRTLAGLAAALGIAAPAAAQVPTWDMTTQAFDQGQGKFGEVLAYSVNNSDSLQCHYEGPRTHSGLTHVLWIFTGAHPRRHADDSWPTTLTLTAGTVTAHFKATASDDVDGTPQGSSVMVEANLPVKSAVIQAFGRTGMLTLSAEGATQLPAPAPRAIAAKFVALCSK